MIGCAECEAKEFYSIYDCNAEKPPCGQCMKDEDEINKKMERISDNG